MEQLFKKTQFLVNQFAKWARSVLLSHPASSACLHSFQAFVLSRLKETGLKKAQLNVTLKESRPAPVLKVKTIFYGVCMQTKIQCGRGDMYLKCISLLRVSGRGTDILKYILHKWKLLVCDVGCSIPAVRGTIHLKSWLSSSVNSGDVIDYCSHKKH